MKKNVMAIVLSATMLIAMAGCSGGSDSDNKGEIKGVWDPYTPYEETVTFTKGLATSGANSENIPKGDTFSNNAYTRYVEQQLNVKTEIAWETDHANFNQKVALAIASQDIPDVMVVNREIFKQLVDNDLIHDMTSAYEQCISPFLKEQFDSFGPRLFKEVTVDGKMMGIPGTQIAGQHNVLWIRKDWLDKLNLPVPQTLPEIEKTLKTFVDKNAGGHADLKTMGLLATEEVYGGYNSSNGLYSLFNAYDAYPSLWVEKDGKAVYGSTQPEMKKALEELNRMYKAGLIDKEFAIRKAQDRDAFVSNGQAGMVFAPWWGFGGMTESVTNDPKAEWICVPAPVVDGKIKTFEQDPIGGILVVSKKFKNPEAIVKTLNVCYDAIRGNGESGQRIYEEIQASSPGLSNNACPVGLQIDYEDAIAIQYKDLMQAVEKKDYSLIQRKGSKSAFDSIIYNMENPKKDLTKWSEAVIRTIGVKAAIDEKVTPKPVKFYGTTETMTTKWANLKKLETETMIKIIMGEKPLSEFDNFVTQWETMGGKEITAEVEKEIAR